MSSNALRAAILGALFLATSPTLAAAAPVRVNASGVLDASTDGHLLLLRDGSVVDRQTGAVRLLADPDQNLDLAADSLATLQRSADGYLFLRTLLPDGSGFERLVSASPAGLPIRATTAVLARDATTVFFTTAGPSPSIIERDLTTDTSTVRLTNATLLDASEDGRVITFSRALPAIQRPAGAAIVGDPGAPIPSLAIGYQVAGGAPRLIDQTRYAQQASGSIEQGCPTSVSSALTRPLDLHVSQDGDGGRYVLTQVSTSSSKGGALTSTTFTRLGANGEQVIGTTDGQSTGAATITTDPVSGAYVLTVSPRLSGWISSARMTTDDGRSFALPVPAPAGAPVSATTQYVNVVPFSRGAGAASDLRIWAMPAGPLEQYSGAWVDADLGEVGPTTAAWAELPRAGDAVLAADLASDQTWVTCPGVVGAPADYAAIQPMTTGNSAGTIAVRRSPYGKVPATRVTATVRWYGLPIWTRRVTADATLRLPALLPGVPGFAASVTITLTDGTVLTESAALRRTR